MFKGKANRVAFAILIHHPTHQHQIHSVFHRSISGESIPGKWMYCAYRKCVCLEWNVARDLVTKIVRAIFFFSFFSFTFCQFSAHKHIYNTHIYKRPNRHKIDVKIRCNIKTNSRMLAIFFHSLSLSVSHSFSLCLSLTFVDILRCNVLLDFSTNTFYLLFILQE